MMKVIFIIAALLAIFALYCRITGNTYDSSIFGVTKITGKSTAVPFWGRIFPNWWLVEKARFSGKKNWEVNVPLIEAFVVKWVLEVRVKLVPNAMDPQHPCLALGPDNGVDDPGEAELYHMLLDASGGTNILDSNAFTDWSRKHFKQLAEYPDRAKAWGEQYFDAIGYLDKDKHTVREKYPEMRQAMELKNYLNEFNAAEGMVAGQPWPWKDYLVLGMLFGCYGKLLPQLKMQHPADFDNYARSLGMDPYQLLYNLETAPRVIAPGYLSAAKMYNADTIDPFFYGS